MARSSTRELGWLELWIVLGIATFMAVWERLDKWTRQPVITLGLNARPEFPNCPYKLEPRG